MSLDADTAQEMRHTTRKQAEMLEIMHAALKTTSIPEGCVEALLLEWWRMILQPQIQMPDFAAIFGKKDDE